MGGTANGWRTVIDGEDWMRSHEKRLLHEERRAAITQASDILGPGFDSTAIPLDDWNSEETLFNGLWYSTPGAANAPNGVSAFAGQTITYSDGTGIQIAYSLTEPPVLYQRNVTVDASGVRVFGAWATVSGGGGGGAPTGPAGGDLTGTYPNPQIAANAVTSAKVLDNTLTAADMNSAYKDGTNATPSMRTLGYGAGQAMEGGRPLNWIVQPDGDVTMNGFKVTNVATPVSANDAANKTYVDTSRIDIRDEGATVQADATAINFVGAGVTATGAGGTATVTILGGGGAGGEGAPVGCIFGYPSSAAPPLGYLVGDGSAVSRTTYSDLFSVYGTTYGSGNGSTTFNLPNLKSRTLVGLDTSQVEFDTVGKTGGAKTHTLTVAEMPDHDHNGNTGGQSANHTHGMDHNHTVNSRAGTGANANAVPRSDASTIGTFTGAVNAVDMETGGASVGHTHAIPAQGGGGAHNNLQPYFTVQWIIKAVAGADEPSTLTVEDEGVPTVIAATGLNFVGAGVTVTAAGSGEATVTIPSGADVTKTGIGCVMKPLINIPTGPTSTSLAVTWPVGLFTSAPVVVATPESSVPGAFNVSVGAVSTTGGTIFANRASGSAFPNLPINVIART